MSETDPTATEPAVESPFERVPLALRQALEGRGFTELTAVQVAVLDGIEVPRDLRISSQTGSGKTVALGLALAADLLQPVHGAVGPTALVVVPTRELAAQVQQELAWLYAHVPGVRVDSVTGGTHVGQERRRLARRPRILVGTPGRLVDHIGSAALDCGSITQLVLDEADQMLDMGFRDDLDAILAAIPEPRRTHLLSATFPVAVRELVARFQSNPRHVEGTQLGAANDDIVHVGHVVRPRDRYAALVNLLLLADAQRTLVFVATRADCASLAEKLSGDGFSAMPLSGELAQRQRTRTLNAFRAGTVDVLVATDVAARGLDIPDVSLVIHGDLPMDGEIYTHRSGRTGRAGRKGRSVLLATPNAERRARRILADARVDAQWPLVPGAADVRKALQKRQRRRLLETVTDPDTAPGAEHLELAHALLDGRDPAGVVASLLASMPMQAREPLDLETPMPRSPARERRADAPRAADAFVRFRVNWGARSGANPRRLLAMICRRGNIRSGVVGAIDVGAHSTTFGVASEAARDFEVHAGRRDSREPNQRIERVRDPAGRARVRVGA